MTFNWCLHCFETRLPHGNNWEAVLPGCEVCGKMPFKWQPDIRSWLQTNINKIWHYWQEVIALHCEVNSKNMPARIINANSLISFKSTLCFRELVKRATWMLSDRIDFALWNNISEKPGWELYIKSVKFLPINISVKQNIKIGRKATCATKFRDFKIYEWHSVWISRKISFEIWSNTQRMLWSHGFWASISNQIWNIKEAFELLVFLKYLRFMKSWLSDREN